MIITKIQLNEADSEIRPGGRIYGTLIIESPEKEWVNYVKLLFHGEEKIKLQDLPGDDFAYTKMYGHKIFAKEVQVSDKTQLPKRLEFPFTFKIPSNILPSFRGDRTEVRYFIYGWTERTFSNKLHPISSDKIKIPIPPLSSEVARQNIVTSVTDPTKKPFFQFQMPTVFHPGQDVVGKFVFQSEGRHPNDIRIELFKTEKVQIGWNRQQNTKRVITVTIPGKQMVEGIPYDIHIHIPEKAPPSLRGQTFEISYSLKVTARVRWHRDTYLRIPVQVVLSEIVEDFRTIPTQISTGRRKIKTKLKGIIPQLKLETYRAVEPTSDESRIQTSKIERIKKHSQRSTPLKPQKLTTQQWELSSTELSENVTELQKIAPVTPEEVLNPLKDHRQLVPSEMLRVDTEKYLTTLPTVAFTTGIMQLCVCGKEIAVTTKKCPYCGQKF
ncbi:MAG: hypothetical protein ACFFDT_22015 [Candidatus Hodarchaeota archaeon]